MAKIKNYNPNLGFRLNDLKMLFGLSNYQIVDVLKAICNSVDGDTTYSFNISQCQIVYNLLMRNITDNVESYDRYLIEKLGYTRDEIEEYHDKENERINKEEGNG